MGQFQRAAAASSPAGDIPLPGDDKELVYAPLGTPEADAYLDDMALGANFATVNHLLINALVLEAFQEVIPGVTGELVYFISHNIARKEIVDNAPGLGASQGSDAGLSRRAPRAEGTRSTQTTGHPILLPGNPQAGSSVMVADAGARAELLQREPRRRPHAGPQARRSANSTRQSIDQSFDAARHPHQLPPVPQGRSPRRLQGFRRSPALGEDRRPGDAKSPG